MSEPIWMEIARGYIGTREISGPKHNPRVVELWEKAKVAEKVTDDETPWCAAFVSAVLEDAGIESPKTGWARGYLGWGRTLLGPRPGCIVVFARGKVFGHVGFVVGRDKWGNLLVLGGNQGDAVNIKAFSVDRVLGYQWPKAFPLPPLAPLPILASDGSLSSNEA